MAVPVELYGSEFIEDLRDLRDQALVESHLDGKRKKLGKFSFGIALAWWSTKDDQTAHLMDEGLRYGENHITPGTTELTIYNYRDLEVANGVPIVQFVMNFGTENIGVYRTILPQMSVRSLFKWQIAKRQERKFNLHSAQDEGRASLFREMERGASGLYAITSSPEEW